MKTLQHFLAEDVNSILQVFYRDHPVIALQGNQIMNPILPADLISNIILAETVLYCNSDSIKTTATATGL